jgi:CheY-like chemotaxis protein
MTRINRGSVMTGDCSTGELLPSSEEVVEVRRRDNSIPRLAADKRMLRVLVVDDNRDAADSLSQLVSLWRNEVRTAYGGAPALEMAALLKPDVVLLDLSMPKTDGCQVARRLRRQTAFADTLLIAITGWTDQPHRLLCAEAGFDHFLIKPIDLDDLKNLLLRERRRLARSAEAVDKANGAGGAVITAAKKAAFSRADRVVGPDRGSCASVMKPEVLQCWS